jgi:hypothetical protein
LKIKTYQWRPHSDWKKIGLMVFNATFNNILVISWQSVLLVEEIGRPPNLSQVTDKLYHIMLYTSPWSRFELTSVVIVTDCLGSCISNYHTITAMTAPTERWRIAIKPLFFNIWFLHDFNMDFLSRSPSKSVLFYLLQLLSKMG